MSLREIGLEELQELAKLKNNWYSVAVAIEKIKAHVAGHQNISRRIKEACEATGYSPNTVNRMLAVKAFFDSVRDKVKGLDEVDPNTLSFPSLEVVKRLHQVNPEEGIGMLREVVKGGITFRDLRERYNKLISDDNSTASIHQISKRESLNFEEAALNAVRRASGQIFQVDFELPVNKTQLQHLPFVLDAVAQDINPSGSNSSLSGFEFFFFRADENVKRRFDLFINRLLFTANFFTAIWVVFPSDMGIKRMRAFLDIMDLLDCPSIGVAEIPWNGKFEKSYHIKVIRRPTKRPSAEISGKIDRFIELHHRLVQPDKV